MARENRVEIPLGLGYWVSRSSQNNRLSLKNWYPEQDPAGKSKIYLAPTLGSRVVYTHTGGNRTRALIQRFSVGTYEIYAVIGKELLELGVTSDGKSFILNNSWTLTDFLDGTGSGESRPVLIHQMSNDDLFIQEMSVGTSYVLDRSAGTVSKVTDPDYPGGVLSSTYLDEYIIVNPRYSNKIYASDLADPTSYDATAFASKEGFPDDIQRLITNLGYLWVFGTHSTEVWYNSGNVDFPFEPMSNVFFEVGLLNPMAITVMDSVIYTVTTGRSGGPEVSVIEGFNIRKISTPPIDDLLRYIGLTPGSVNNVGDNVVLQHYKHLGHSFVVLKILNRQTAVYDIQSQQWHLIESDLSVLASSDNHLISESVANVFGEVLVASGRDNKIYLISDLEYTDGAVYTDLSWDTWQSGTNIEREVVTQYFEDKAANIQWHTIELEVEQPVTTVDGSTPTITLEWSNDGGENWSTPQSRDISTTGKSRLRWHRLGDGRDRVFRFKTSSPAPIFLHNCWADITKNEW